MITVGAFDGVPLGVGINCFCTFGNSILLSRVEQSCIIGHPLHSIDLASESPIKR